MEKLFWVKLLVCRKRVIDLRLRTGEFTLCVINGLYLLNRWNYNCRDTSVYSIKSVLYHAYEIKMFAFPFTLITF